jgi:flagellar biosynthesis GTPase FlhF
LSAAALPAAAPDDFEEWSQQRDRRWDRFVSAQYVSPDVVGYEDLDDYGSWSSTPEYGNVWYPNDVEQGWAPYRTGHWAYIAPWGYTWVDLKPWGFAPFHYGRWVWTGRAWGWIPCPPRPERGPYIRPVYAPALVAWVGVGAGVAWFALGPREVYVPSYHVSEEYVRNVNVSNTTVNRTVIDNVYNTTIINNRTVNVTYVNRGAPGAVTATSTQAFASAQPVQSHRIAYDPAARRGEPVRALAPAVVPARQSVLGAARASAAPPATVQSRSIVARTAPPPPPVSVDRRLEALRGNGGKPLSPAEVSQIRSSAPPPRPNPIRIAPAVAPAALTNAPHVHASDAAPPDNRTPHPSMPISRPAPAAVHVNELPPPSRPASPNAADTALEREHLQQQQQLQSRQEQERQRIQQQQELEHQQAVKQQAEQLRAQELERQQQQQQQQRAQEQAAQHAQQQALAREQAARQQADQARAQELERQHQLQTQQLQQQHIEQQQQLEARQREQVEQQNQRRTVPPKPQDPKKNQ